MGLYEAIFGVDATSMELEKFYENRDDFGSKSLKKKL